MELGGEVGADDVFDADACGFDAALLEGGRVVLVGDWCECVLRGGWRLEAEG